MRSSTARNSFCSGNLVAVEDGQSLAGQHEYRRPLRAQHGRAPGPGRFIGVCRADDTDVGHGPERSEVFDRLVGWSIFTEADDLDQLQANIRDAVRCHFEEGTAPKVIRLHFVREQVIGL